MHLDVSSGIVDLRPHFFNEIVQDLIELLEYGCIVTLFLEKSNWLVFKNEEGKVSYKTNFFSIIEKITGSSLKLEKDNLKNFNLTEDKEEDFSFLENYKANFSYKIEKFNKNFTPIIVNKWGKPIGGIFKQKEWAGSLVILPFFKKYGNIVKVLINQNFPKLNPNLSEIDHSWTKSILLPTDQTILHSIQDLEQEINELKLKRKNYRERYNFFFDLLTFDSSNLVNTVIQVLEYIGFREVINVDEGKTGDKDLEEDIRVEDNAPNLIIEVKGIKRLPHEEHISQLDKFVTRRRSENQDKEYHGVLYINHERQLPLDQRSNMPFTEKQIQDAIYKDFTLIDSKRFFHLLIGKITYNWDSKILRDLFLQKGRISNIPNHFIDIGTIKNLVKDKMVIIIDLKEPISNDDKLGFIRENKYYQTNINTIQLNGQIVNQASTGDGIGIHIEDNFPLTRGQTVYKTNKLKFSKN